MRSSRMARIESDEKVGTMIILRETRIPNLSSSRMASGPLGLWRVRPGIVITFPFSLTWGQASEAEADADLH